MAIEEAGRRQQIEDRLRSNLVDWRGRLEDIQRALTNLPQYYGRNPDLAASHAKNLDRIMQEISQSASDLTVISQDLTAAKADAEYRAVLVQAWPGNSFLDRLAYLGAAILGAGGAAYLFGGWPVTIVFWVLGGILMAWALTGLRSWEMRKWEFYADQFSVGEAYRPWGREAG